MSDLIDRQAATHTALEFIVEYLGGAFDEGFQKKLIERMNELPSAQPEPSDAVYRLYKRAYEAGQRNAQTEIIRCKDCKWKQGAECVRFAEIRPFPDDFCSRAERRKK